MIYRILILLFTLFIFSCSLTESEKSDAVVFTIPDSTEHYIYTGDIFYLEPFFNYDTMFLAGTRICTLIVDGVIDSVFTEEILYTIEKDTAEQILTDPANGKTVQVTPLTHTLYRDNVISSQKRVYFQKRMNGYYQLFYDDMRGRRYNIDEKNRRYFPAMPASGSLLDSTGSHIADTNNSWNAAVVNPILDSYPIDQNCSYTKIEGAFALDLLGQNKYHVNNMLFSDGIDVKTYHQFHREQNINGTAVKTYGAAVETHYYFKNVGLRETRASVTTEKIYGDSRYERTFDHYILKYTDQ